MRNMKNQKQNLYWIELCGFDKTKADYGVGELLKSIPQAVDGFVILFANLEFYHEFTADSDDVLLSINECAYGGKKRFGEERSMRWSKGQLKDLILTLHGLGKSVYATVFDGIEFPTKNPFANENQTVFQLSYDGCGSPVCDLTSNLANGAPYASFLGQKIRETVQFYGFDGVHFADGISSWRLPLQINNYSPERLLAFSKYLAESGEDSGAERVKKLADTALKIGAEYRKRSEKIWKDYRKDWIEFLSKLWAERFALLVLEIPEDIKIIINAAWTRDPFEAKYRYGFDFNLLDFSRIFAYVYNDVNRKITPKEDSCGFHISSDEYRYYENEAPAATETPAEAIAKANETPAQQVAEPTTEAPQQEEPQAVQTNEPPATVEIVKVTESEFRMWTDHNGKKIKARWLATDNDGEHITLETPSGKKINAVLRKFSAEDRAYIQSKLDANR